MLKKVFIVRIITLLLSIFSSMHASQQEKMIDYEQATFLYKTIQSKQNIKAVAANLEFSLPRKRTRSNSNNVCKEDESSNIFLLNYKDKYGNTIMHHACACGHKNLLNELLKIKGPTEIANDDGKTPIFYAANSDIANILIDEHSHSIMHKDHHNNLPLIQHITDDNITVAKKLLQEINKLKTKTLVAHNQHPFIHIKSLDMAQLLIGSPHCTTTISTEKLIQVNQNLSRKAFWSCMSIQPNINIQNKFNETLLHYAAKKNCDDIASKLFDKNINIFAQSVMGQTALHIATYHNYSKFITSLLNHAKYLETFGFQDALSTLLETNDIDGSTALMVAVLENKTDTARQLIQAGADIHTRNKYGHGLLHFVKDPILTQELLNLGLNVNNQGIYKHTPLHFAANTQIAQIFIENNADINAQTIDQTTPLHTAKNTAIAKILIDAQASVHNKDSQGRTPLHIAVIKNNATYCKLLLDNHADINDKDANGKTPLNLMWWCKQSHQFFLLEDLEVLLKNIPRIPLDFDDQISQKLSDTSYIENAEKIQKDKLNQSKPQ